MKTCACISFILLFFAGVKAQYQQVPACEVSNPSLVSDLHQGFMKEISLWSEHSSYGAMASSTLQPKGKFPHEKSGSDQTPIKDLTDDDIATHEIEKYNESQDWYCQYSAYNLRDSDSSTAWVEEQMEMV